MIISKPYTRSMVDRYSGIDEADLAAAVEEPVQQQRSSEVWPLQRTLLRLQPEAYRY